jgi:iron complex transport system substrate-binding protein
MDKKVIKLIKLIKLFVSLLVYIYLNNANAKAKNTLNDANIRLISLSPNITEMVYELNLQQYLIGVSAYSDYPLEAKQKPIFADYNTLYIEQILAAKYNYNNSNVKIIALAWQGGTPKKYAQILDRYSIKTIWLPSSSPLEVINGLKIIANLFNNHYNDEKLSQTLSQTLNYYVNKPKLSYYYPIWQQPLMILTGNNYTDNLLAYCNISNIFAKNITNIVNNESVYSAMYNNKIQLIIASNKEYKINLKPNDINIPIAYINADLIVRPSARSILEIGQTCKNIRSNYDKFS